MKNFNLVGATPATDRQWAVCAGQAGLGLGSRRLPPPRPDHRLAVWLARKLAKHRSGVQILTRAKLFARFATPHFVRRGDRT